MRILTVCLLLCSTIAVQAQKKDKKVEKIAKTITPADMKRHLYKIASKEMGGRDTPSPGQELAATYIENHFKSLGLLPGNNGSYRQYYPLYKDSMTSTSLKVDGTSFANNKDFQPASTNYSAQMLFSDAVFAGFGNTEDDYKDLRVAGKLVIVTEGNAAGQTTARINSAKITLARNKGVAALLIVSSGFPRTSAVASAWTRSNFKPMQSPLTFTISSAVAASIMGDDAKTITEKAKQGVAASKTYTKSIDLSYMKTVVTTQVSNVIALLEGTDKKDEYVFLTSHYDHVGQNADGSVIYYGADDDGSGTTGILELSEAFAKAKAEGKGPRRSIVFMTVSGEEKGLWGSEYYGDHPIFPLEKTTVDLNIDMIGRVGEEYQQSKDSGNYVYIIGDDKLSSDLFPITEQVNKTYMKMNLDRKYNDPNDPNRFYYRSDHYNFAEKGVPIIFYFNGVHADYHQPTDTPDKINYDVMAKRGQLVFYTAWEMANRNEMLKRDIKLEKPKGF